MTLFEFFVCLCVNMLGTQMPHRMFSFSKFGNTGGAILFPSTLKLGFSNTGNESPPNTHRIGNSGDQGYPIFGERQGKHYIQVNDQTNLTEVRAVVHSVAKCTSAVRASLPNCLGWSLQTGHGVL